MRGRQPELTLRGDASPPKTDDLGGVETLVRRTHPAPRSAVVSGSAGQPGPAVGAAGLRAHGAAVELPCRDDPESAPPARGPGGCPSRVTGRGDGGDADLRLQRVLSLPGEPRSAGRARSFLRTTLRDAGRDEWTETASLAVSELVTNALLHAHSNIELKVEVSAEHLRVEVRDFNPVLPSARAYEDHATTGRGLELVAAVTDGHGVDSLGADGKVVWFCVDGSGAVEDRSAEELLAEWDDAGAFRSAEGHPAEEPDVVTVVLKDLPATLWLAAREHQDAVLRELALLRAAPGASPDLGLTADLAAADDARFTISAAVDLAVERARASGTASVPLPQSHPGALPPVPALPDLWMAVRPGQAGSFAQLQDALDEGERLAAAGRLLVHPGLPEITAVRDWACEQVIAQLGGSPPAAWPGADQERFTDEVDRTDLPSGWDDSTIRQAKVGAIAVDDRNWVVAVSPPLAQVLGWSSADLVGRRVVAIVPPRFREAHVAGFTRHLSTGAARALGVDLRLPVLRADGTEIDCQFRIDSEATPSGRLVYLAWITPIGDVH